MANEKARELRRKQTDAELALWQALRKSQVEGFRFRRQVPVGPYIADFVCHSAKLVIEVDGSQHEQNQAYGKVRTARMEIDGYRVLRFWNNEVLGNIEGVLEVVRSALLQGENS